MFEKVISVVKENPEVVKKVAVITGTLVGVVAVGLVLKKFAPAEALVEIIEEAPIVEAVA